MNLTFNKRYFAKQPGASAGGGVDPLSMALSAVQTGLGIVQSISGKAKMNKLLSQRKAYETPEEYYDILQATESVAQQGYDAFTLNYLTGQLDRGLSSSLGAATRLGADPNDLSAIYDRFEQGIMKVGAENHALNMENFSKYLSAKDVIGQNKAAEWASQQDIIKDKMQAAGSDMQAGLQNVGSGVNAMIGTSAAAKMGNLYSEKNNSIVADLVKAMKALNSKGGAAQTSVYAQGYAPDFDNYNQPG